MADVNGEVKKIDAEQAFKIYDREVAPKQSKLNEIKGDMSEPWDRIKECNFPKKIMSLIAWLENQEDSKRDHMLIALDMGLRLRNLGRPADLVNLADGVDIKEPIVPVSSSIPDLHTVN